MEAARQSVSIQFFTNIVDLHSSQININLQIYIMCVMPNSLFDNTAL